MNTSLSASAIPVAMRTPLNTPPAPVISMIIPAGPRALVEISTKSSLKFLDLFEKIDCEKSRNHQSDNWVS